MSSKNPVFPTPKPRIDQDTFLGLIWGGFALSALFVMFRAWVRLRSFKQFFWDDAFVLAASLMLLATAIIWQCISKYMYEALYIASGESLVIPPTLETDSEKCLRGELAIFFLFWSGLWSVKFSFLIFFRRLGDKVSGQKLHWWIVLLSTLATYIVGIGTIQFHCLTPSFEEIIKNCSGSQAVTFERVTLCTNRAMDVLTDFAILSIPIPMLWRVRIRIRQKLALSALFCLVVITMVISIIRFAVFMNFSSQPEQTWLYLWSAIENSVAIIVVCLASFRALFTKQDHRIKVPDCTEDSRKRALYRSLIKCLETMAFWSHSSPSHSAISKLTGRSSDPIASEENIVPPDRVLVRNEFEMSSMTIPRELEV